MPFVLFICTYLDGRYRVQANGPGTKHRRVVCSWRRTIGDEETPVIATPGSAVQARALILISASGCRHNKGCLTDTEFWTDKQVQYYGLPADWYEVRVEKIRPLRQAENMTLRYSRPSEGGGLSTIQLRSPFFFPFWGKPPLDTSLKRRWCHPAIVAAQVSEWGFQGSEIHKAPNISLLL